MASMVAQRILRLTAARLSYRRTLSNSLVYKNRIFNELSTCKLSFDDSFSKNTYPKLQGLIASGLLIALCANKNEGVLLIYTIC